MSHDSAKELRYGDPDYPEKPKSKMKYKPGDLLISYDARMVGPKFVGQPLEIKGIIDNKYYYISEIGYFEEGDMELYLPTQASPPKPVTPDGGGLRYNEGKPRFDLVPPEAMIALAAHYEVGAKKYADRNWERGMAWGKCFASMMRHAWAWMRGEDYDQETGTHHMIAVAWNAIALFVYHERKIGEDDRPKIG